MEVRGKRELEVAATPSGAVGLPPDWMNIKFWSPANNHDLLASSVTTIEICIRRKVKHTGQVHGLVLYVARIY